MYKRKTSDEFQIHGDYGFGWEEVTCADTRKEARSLLKDYRANDPHPHKLVVKRVKK